ncbi:phosphoglycolate phosphatase [Phenylobacterium sp. Root700]|uniref:phosphoglycolate phosphatase n=1 Tax=Phenylobacterium sp. Root700 TaxID=1736591 RepID=UPI0007011E7E|nr:phosphoglycolate phosphatase [Phenylobacterium sp. Root700]KRB40128.1 phosphoglycolate phosphatase [Phenylobacterium sp. Root700]
MTDLTALAGATIVFDLDGTLVDSAPDLIGTLNVILAQEGIAPLPFDEARPFIGHGARRLLERGFAAQGHPAPAERMPDLFARFIAHYNEHSADETRPYPGVVRCLTELKAAGARLAVCTNKLTDLSLPILEKLDLIDFFDAVIGADLAPAPKPDARHLTHTIAVAGGRIDRAVMVGDASTDAGAARAAKVPLVLVSFGYTEVPAAELGPDVLLHHFDELKNACVTLLTACPAQDVRL